MRHHSKRGFNRITDGVLDAQVDLLGAIGSIGGYDDGVVRNEPQRSPITLG